MTAFLRAAALLLLLASCHPALVSKGSTFPAGATKGPMIVRPEPGWSR
jgi:hypothetical protein